MTKKSLIVSGVCLTALLICVGCASTGTYTDSQGNPIPAGAAKAYNSGNASFKLGKYQEAIDDYTKAIGLDPNSGDAYCNRANALFMLGKLGDVIRDCTKAIELNANDTNAYYLRGVDYQMLLKYPEAIKDFNAVLKLNPNAQDARQARDECQKALDAGGKVVKAADELLKSTNFFNFLRSTNFFNQ